MTTEGTAGGTRVEVLMATRNSADFLEPMIESLLAQTHDDFQLVVSDDCSTDATQEILARLAPRFRHPPRLILRETPSGSASANFGSLLAQSTGDYVFLADHDDIWLPGRIAADLVLLRAAEERSGRDTPILVHRDLAVIDGDGSSTLPSYWAFKKIVPEAGARLSTALMHGTVTGCAAAMNQALVRRAGAVPPEAIMHDWWLNLVATAFGEVIWDRTPQTRYRIHGRNVSRPREVGIVAGLGQLDRMGRLRGNIRRRYAQGKALADRFGDTLPEPARSQIAAFVRLQRLPVPLRQAALVRGGFLWPGLWRNLVQLPFA